MHLGEKLLTRRDAILAIAARHGATKVRVFGSQARGEAGPASDVDFLVELEPARSLFDLGGLLTDLQALLGCKVDVVTEKGASASYPRAGLARGGVPVRDDRERPSYTLEDFQ